MDSPRSSYNIEDLDPVPLYVPYPDLPPPYEASPPYQANAMAVPALGGPTVAFVPPPLAQPSALAATIPSHQRGGHYSRVRNAFKKVKNWVHMKLRRGGLKSLAIR
ncbi:hypothetical protein B0H12DRAFT_1234395 [Mycena haematopus]|nr:hypothetical protein B0H12DRAFT_1234395 [Mycena haematopus]